MPFRAYAVSAPGGPLAPFSYDPGPLGEEEVEIAVRACGVCHSDLSMIRNDWAISAYPLVPGHEVVGTVAAAGPRALGARVGQRVGLGWYSRSCMGCRTCLRGDQNLCATVEGTIIARHGGFADRVRCHWAWATPLPEALGDDVAGPLFCAGLTVFTPIAQFGVKPTDRVGVVGIGGLGHLAIQFLNKWGCEVTAFTSSAAKQEEAKRLGAHHAVPSTDSAALRALKGQLDFILVTVNVSLDWQAYVDALAPRGRLHVVGVVPEPIPVAAFALISSQRSVSGSPSGSPSTTATMLDFAARHGVRPAVETFPMSKVNDAMARLESGKARYRVVIENDFGS